MADERRGNRRAIRPITLVTHRVSPRKILSPVARALRILIFPAPKTPRGESNRVTTCQTKSKRATPSHIETIETTETNQDASRHPKHSRDDAGQHLSQPHPPCRALTRQDSSYRARDHTRRRRTFLIGLIGSRLASPSSRRAPRPRFSKCCHIWGWMGLLGSVEFFSARCCDDACLHENTSRSAYRYLFQSHLFSIHVRDVRLLYTRYPARYIPHVTSRFQAAT